MLFYLCTHSFASWQVQFLRVEQEAMETSSQQDLERKMAGLKNEVQVQIMLLYAIMCFVDYITVHPFIHVFLCTLGYSAWSIQCYVWRSSKMSLILNTRLTRWKVMGFQISGYICMLWWSSLMIHIIRELVIWVIKRRESQLPVSFCFGPSYLETVIPPRKWWSSCGWRGREARKNQTLSVTYQQTEWLSKGIVLLY